MRLKMRERAIIALASGNGMACYGGIREKTSCGLEKRDCIMSDWTEWDSCDRTCGGGQQQRHRQIHTFPKNGGNMCPVDSYTSSFVTIMVKGCNLQACVQQDCILSPWSHWSACSGDCGTGQVTRSRSITQFAVSSGVGCTEDVLLETTSC